MSQKYKESLSIVESPGTLTVTLKYRGRFNEPLGRWFEYGTKRHWMEPKVKHPPGGVREGRQTERVEKFDNPRGIQAPQVLSWLQDGERRYSRGHWVSGLEAGMVMTQTRNDVATGFLYTASKVEAEDDG